LDLRITNYNFLATEKNRNIKENKDLESKENIMKIFKNKKTTKGSRQIKMNLEGKLLGNRYEIIEKIGSGGMATVYKAKCLVLKRFVAVKVLRDEFTTDEEFIKFYNENSLTK
jgi:hypothetical protein